MGPRKTILLGCGLTLAVCYISFLGLPNTQAQVVTATPAAAEHQLLQTAPAGLPEPQRTTKLVRVSVVVRDSHGNPVGGLTPDDFILLDDGRPQAIQHFTVATNRPVDHYTPPLEADTYSNRLEDHPRIPDNATVILLDGANTRFEDQAYARRQTVKLLQQIQPQDYVAVYTLGRELRVLHDFTSDATDLLASLQTYRGEIAANTEESEPREKLGYRLQAAPRSNDMLEPFLTFGAQLIRDSDIQNLERLTADALTAIVDHLAVMPGRKNLIWVSERFPIWFENTKLESGPRGTASIFGEETKAALRAVNEKGIAIYPVSAGGLMPSDQSLLKLSSSGAGRAGLEVSDHADLDKMKNWADRTGGELFLHPDDIFGSVRSAMDDSQESYELGYYADAAASDVSFHTLTVSVRRIGVQVRARSGYFALPNPTLTSQIRKSLLANIATSPLDATGIGIRVRVKAANLPGTQKLNARVEFRPQEISFAQVDGRWVGKVDAVVVQLDARNRIVDAMDETLDLNFLPDRFQQALKMGISFARDVAIQPDAAALRVILRDTTTGTAGSVGIPVLQYFLRVKEEN
ncbi:MAG TPA: VWA domain-containing protein [Candidatus Limnocylindria bacterium]|nr:VWA domain-containing protein [Candidatus Limnocylindria bacterium]